MSLADWAKRSMLQMSVMGARDGGRAAGFSLWQGLAHRAGNRLDHGDGKTIWERDWDVLILLDACRPGALEAVADEYAFLPDSIPTAMSPASCSQRWMEATFGVENRSEVSDVAYVTGNVFSRDLGSDGLVGPDAFAELREVWQTGWDEDVGTVSPRVMTNQAIQAWRSGDCERMIVHYMQPHAPYRSLISPDGFEDPARSMADHRLTVWDMLRAGHLSEETAQAAYRDNLCWALDEVMGLLSNCDAEDVVISADHGELFGEYGLYSHPDVPALELRTVPWVSVESVDEQTRAADGEPKETDATVSEQLEALGYR